MKLNLLLEIEVPEGSAQDFSDALGNLVMSHDVQDQYLPDFIRLMLVSGVVLVEADVVGEAQDHAKLVREIQR